MVKKKAKIMTEALAVFDGKVLLGRRKKQGFGQGKWLGLGGKVEAGETIEAAMIRECFEEANITVTEYIERGELLFHYINDPDMEVHYYKILEYEGEISDSEEMEVKWVSIDKIPYDNMFPNDRYWLPMFLEGKYFKGEFFFDADYKISDYSINK